MQKIKIYIASPYTNGWMPLNVQRQLALTENLILLGFYPYTPLLNHFTEIYTNKVPEYKWLDLDFEYLKICDAILRIKPLDKNGNEITSYGADLEESLAKKHGIPIFYDIDDLINYFKLINEDILN